MAPGRWFVRHVTYPCLFRPLRGIGGRRIAQRHDVYCESERWPPERHREAQWQRIRRLLEHAHAHCRLHRERMSAIGAEPGDFRNLEDFAKIPPLTRDDLQTRFDDLLADNADPKTLEIHHTSGSTGTPLHFASDKDRYLWARAMLHRNHRWCGLELGERHGYLWASFIDHAPSKRLVNRLGNWLLNQVFISIWELTPEEIRRHNDLFRRRRIRLLTSFSSTLNSYARAVERLGLQPPPLRAIISTGETLFPQQRALAEEVFGCRVFNRYGNMENGDIAHECEAHDGLHTNEERVYVEIEPDPDLPHGTGDILVTDLDNWSMPFLRYKTGDLGRWHTDPTGCPCGRPLRRLAEVQGRRYDVVISRDGVPINGLVIEDLGSGAPGVAQFQCIQRAPEQLLFRIVPMPGFTAEQIRENIIRRSEISIGPDPFEIDVELVDEIAPSKSGKLRQIISEVTGER